ncbi:ATP-binding protein [Sphaerisporangium rhizosphaerae]|uniref:ATP-binding protein n=1 Tax=Sphaerisporangium rhizosphaerae TaxID=2269375 RepID=A0ABW2PAI0_9ACTN
MSHYSITPSDLATVSRTDLDREEQISGEVGAAILAVSMPHLLLQVIIRLLRERSDMAADGRAATVNLVGTRTSVRRARQFTQDLLGEDHPAVDDAVLAVSELVTNSLRHSRSGEVGGTVTLTIRWSDTAIRIEVTDEGSSTNAPRVRDEPEAEGGRGLQIISALAKEWGTSHHGPNVTLWCDIAIVRCSSPPDHKARDPTAR